MFVSARMTPSPVIVPPNTAIADAFSLMKINKFRRLPVVEDGKLVGIVTDRDLREVSPSPATTLSVFELNYLLGKLQVKDIMKKAVITIRDDATIEEAALAMYTNKIGGLVVVDAAGGVAGVITETDIFKCLVDIMGLPEGRTRLTLECGDKIGVLHDVSKVFRDLGINILSMATHRLPDGKFQMVIRADSQDTALISERLTAAGYPVQHVVQIGNP